MPYGLKKQKALASEKTGLHNHQNKHQGLYKKCQTIEACDAEYRKFWSFVAEEFNALLPLPALK